MVCWTGDKIIYDVLEYKTVITRCSLSDAAETSRICNRQKYGVVGRETIYQNRDRSVKHMFMKVKTCGLLTLSLIHI